MLSQSQLVIIERAEGGIDDDDLHSELKTMSSSSSSSSSSNAPQRGRGRRRKQLKSLCWADMWADFRFAIPATVPIEQEFSWRRYDGDSLELYGTEHISVRRKMLEGMDVVVKTFFYSDRTEWLDIRARARREMVIYERLKDLQGDKIPRTVWTGAITMGVADCVAWEYCGDYLGSHALKSTMAAARETVKELHKRGIVHMRLDTTVSYAIDPVTQNVYILNFDRAILREEVELVSHESEWEDLVQRDLDTFDALFEEDIQVFETMEELKKYEEELKEAMRLEKEAKRLKAAEEAKAAAATTTTTSTTTSATTTSATTSTTT